MTACEQSAGSTHLRVRRGEDLGEHLHRELLGERSDRERKQRSAAHREDVIERIRCCDGTVVAGIVDNRREEVEREDERALVVQPVDGCVVGGGEPNEQVLRLRGDEAREQLLETGRRILRGAAAARGEVCQLDAPGVDVQNSPPEG